MSTTDLNEYMFLIIHTFNVLSSGFFIDQFKKFILSILTKHKVSMFWNCIPNSSIEVKTFMTSVKDFKKLYSMNFIVQHFLVEAMISQSVNCIFMSLLRKPFFIITTKPYIINKSAVLSLKTPIPTPAFLFSFIRALPTP